MEDWFLQKLNNSKDPCPQCGRPLVLFYREDLITDSIIVRHACDYCSVVFNPDGSTMPFCSADFAKTTLELWKAEAKIIDEEASRAVEEAESILREQ